MENISRRNFLAGLIPLAISGKSFAKGIKFERNFGKVGIILPEIPFQETVIEGKKKGPTVLIVGGIHGNEPGAYKTAEILRSVEVEKGRLVIAPRANFLSILVNLRGYNGDMNRKFGEISSKDPDFIYVKKLKNLIVETRPSVVLSLHDGFGFHVLNKNFWGQCIVIDEERYKNFELGKVARAVSKRVNRHIKDWRKKIPVYNTHTFSPNTKHPEQRKALTQFCLRVANCPAYCLETSKQLPKLEEKVYYHLLMLKEFFRIYGVSIKPSFNWLIKNIPSLLKTAKASVRVRVNGRNLLVSSSRTFYLKEGSIFEVVSFKGSEGVNAVCTDITNWNWRRFKILRRVAIQVKEDFKELFNLRIVVV
jgi:hypothetical protein